MRDRRRRVLISASGERVVRVGVDMSGWRGGERASGRRAWSRRRFDVVCGLLAVVIVVVGGSGIFVVRHAGVATEVAFEDVVSDFREQGAAGSPGTAPETELVPATAASQIHRSTSTVPVERSVEVAGMAAPPTGASSTSAPPAASPPAVAAVPRPAEGVYRYSADGGESVSIAGGSRRYPDEVYAIVRHTACGLVIEVQVLEEHLDRTELCHDGTTISLVREYKEISFFGQTDSGDIACEPPMPLVRWGSAPAPAVGWGCRAGSIETDGSVALLHTRKVDVGGRAVDGATVEWRWTASGRSEGGGLHTWTFGADGLPLRIERVNDNTSDSALGRVRYEESATFVLASLEPTR
jgi:hypothetical protein